LDFANTAHENALKKFVASVLKPGSGNAFLRDFTAFQSSIGQRGMVNGLAQHFKKSSPLEFLISNQGSELWTCAWLIRTIGSPSISPSAFHAGALKQVRSKCILG